MNRLVSFFILVLLIGCSGMTQTTEPPGDNSTPEQHTRVRLVETQASNVRDCTLLGVITETANDDNLSSTIAAMTMVRRVKKRAVEMGATHIVWLHKTKYAAAAQAFECPDR